MVGVPFNPRQPTGLVDTSHAAADAAQDPLLSLYLAQNGLEPAGAKPDLTENLARAAGQGFTFGWGDELFSLGQAGLDQLLHGDDGKDFWQRYDSNVARERRNLEAFRQENPIAAYGAEILGSLPTALLTGGSSTATGLGRIGTNLLVNGIQGAFYGAGSATGDTPADRIWGAATGAAGGMTAGVALDAAGNAVNAGLKAGAKYLADSKTIAAAPTGAAIKASAEAAREAAESADVVLTPTATSLLKQDLGQTLVGEGVTVRGQMVANYDRVRGSMRLLDQFADEPMTIKSFRRLYESFEYAARSEVPGEAEVAKSMLKQLDSFMDSLPQEAFKGTGDGVEAAAQWSAAKAQLAKFERTNIIETAIKNARTLSDNFPEGLKAEFRDILKSGEKRSKLSPEDITRIEQFAQGDNINKVLKLIKEADLSGFLDKLRIPEIVGNLLQPAVRGGAGALMGHNAKRAGDIVRATTALGAPIPPAPTGTLDLRALAPGLGNNDGVTGPLRIIVNGGNPLLPPYVDDRSY